MATTPTPTRKKATTPSVPKPADATPAPPKLKRRPLLVALAVAFIAIGALLAGYLVTATGDARPVLAVRRDIPRGTVIQRADLIEARINPDPALKTMPATEIDQVVGKRARIDLGTGGLVSADTLTTANIPADGQTIVGVALSPTQMPGQPLNPGARVRIITTPRQQDDPPTKVPDGVRAQVISQRATNDTGQVVIDVTVPTNEAANLAAIVATGRVALILDGVN